MSDSEATTSSLELRGIYAELAPKMDRMAWLNRLVTGRHRRRLFGKARGRTLDVASGLGMNLRYVPDAVQYVGVDLSPEMLARARERFSDRDPPPDFRRMDAAELEFADDSFHTVISSLSTCTFPDPVKVLQEMGRVCRPEGRILLLEHGRSDVGLLAGFQHWRADAHYEKHGCRWDQDPLEVVAQAGLPIRAHRSSLLGVLDAIETGPA
ncbi:MAG: class I SAM-dependent methyltransferase [Gemmatimonadota bacterium]